MKKNAKQFLIDFVNGGCGAHLQFASMVSELVSDDAILNEGQQVFVQAVVQMGPLEKDSSGRLMTIATFINSCH
jgi:hypothetical protein